MEQNLLKQNDYNYDKIMQLDPVQLADVATLILKNSSKEDLRSYKTNKAESGLVVVKGKYYICEYEYAKQVVMINELKKYSRLLDKYVENAISKTFMSGAKENERKQEARLLDTSSQFKVVCNTFIEEVYDKKLDNDNFDDLVGYFIDFMHRNIKLETKKVPIFNVNRSKIVDVQPYDIEIQKGLLSYFQKYPAIIGKDTSKGK